VEVFSLRNMASSRLDLANREADRGNYQYALDLLGEARKLAVRSDDPSLRIRTALSGGNILFFLDRREEAETSLREALAEAEELGDAELAAISRIYLERVRLLPAISNPSASGTAGTAADVRSRVEAELGAVKSDKLAIALGWTVIGLAEKENRRYAEAENAIKRALGIHEPERYLEQAAYDWYLIASIRSVDGRYDAALDALFQALVLDRRAENSPGLALDWRALGDVYAKAGREHEAAAAYRRSEEILGASSLEAE
jgi:tetratricopeptide (TPR) repeat protein